jgi:hypothetical protein
MARMHRWLVGLLATLLCAGTLAADAPRAQVEQIAFDFGRVQAAAPNEHEFRIANIGSAPLRIERVALTPPLRMASMRAQIAPGAEARLRIQLDTRTLAGRYDGRVLLFTNDPAAPEVELAVTGEVVPAIELSPLPALFVAGSRGRGAVATIDIVNREPQPLELGAAQHATDRFTSRVETVEPGQRYRLAVFLKPDGPAGRHVEDITLVTSSKTIPLLTIPAHTLLRERVYTFPEEVDLGALPLNALRKNPELLQRNAQVLMVYQTGGQDFQVTASTDVPGLSIHSERGASADRHQLTIALDHGRRLAAGSVQGSILIRTNDPEFPVLRVPVSGALLAD